MPLDNTDWIRQALSLHRHIDECNDINFVNYQDRTAFQFDVSKLYRAELSNGANPDAWNRTYEYTGSLYLPGGYADVPVGNALLMQWHSQAEDQYAAAPLGLMLEGDNMIIRVDTAVGIPQNYLWQWPVVCNEWLNFRFNIDWGKNRSDGTVLAWLNDSPIVNYTGINAGDTAPYWKFGCYRTRTQGNPFPRMTNYWSNTTRRVI